MKDLIHTALNAMDIGGAEYGDIRIVEANTEDIATKDGIVEALVSSETLGFGIRLIKNGAWGFAASYEMTKSAIQKTVKKAFQIAEASSIAQKEKVVLSKEKVIKATYKTPVKEDPFYVPLSQKIEMLLAAEEAMRVSPLIKISQTNFRALKEKKTFASLEGAFITQELVETGCGLEVTAISTDDAQNRTYPNSHGGQNITGGFELISELNLEENAKKIGEEACQLLTADQCPSGMFDLILDNNQLALQVHESCGHAVEFDRVLGMEASFAGTSFLSPDMLGKFQYGSDKVTITADATAKRGLGTFGFDDEGVPAQRVYIVRNGVLQNFLTSRETAHTLGQKSNGTVRADGWDKLPLIRMTNINLEPGDWTLEKLIADTKYGIFMSSNKSWSIDDRRLNFQFGCEIAWEIKNGKITRVLRNPTYTGMTPVFWNSCDAVCDKNHWVIFGVPNCGKGEPVQTSHVGHGTSPARFRGVQIGVGKW
ncbi:MAG TPA: TldD/PmbA family protein [Patescibacteria group bacterium]|nr:TldD/PmbA family protein [Patescibacteria group bacterium]